MGQWLGFRGFKHGKGDEEQRTRDERFRTFFPFMLMTDGIHELIMALSMTSRVHNVCRFPDTTKSFLGLCRAWPTIVSARLITVSVTTGVDAVTIGVNDVGDVT